MQALAFIALVLSSRVADVRAGPGKAGRQYGDALELSSRMSTRVADAPGDVYGDAARVEHHLDRWQSNWSVSSNATATEHHGPNLGHHVHPSPPAPMPLHQPHSPPPMLPMLPPLDSTPFNATAAEHHHRHVPNRSTIAHHGAVGLTTGPPLPPCMHHSAARCRRAAIHGYHRDHRHPLAGLLAESVLDYMVHTKLDDDLVPSPTNRTTAEFTDTASNSSGDETGDDFGGAAGDPSDDRGTRSGREPNMISFVSFWLLRSALILFGLGEGDCHVIAM